VSGTALHLDVIRIPLGDEAATAALGRRIAELARVGDLIALSGDLGAGKTAFARAFVRALGDAEEEVPSPTFTLVQSYETRNGMVHHFDLYRLSDPSELQEIGFEEALIDGMVLVEWPDRLGLSFSRLHDRRLDLRLEQGSAAEAREAVLSGSADWLARLQQVPRHD
jgi:tRNA threonylcarbamoyladenosine biosynthesis protein TsaE